MIERQCDEILVVDPKAIVESRFQLPSLIRETFRLVSLVKPPQHFGKKLFAYVGKALLFARGDRRRHLPSVLVDDGIAGILPGLVLDAIGRARLIVEESVR